MVTSYCNMYVVQTLEEMFGTLHADLLAFLLLHV